MENENALHVMLHPESVKLAEEVGLLREELIRLLQEREDLVSVVIPNLEAVYYMAIGRYQYDLFRLECGVRRIKRKIEIVQTALNRKEKVEMDQVEKKLDLEQAAWTTLIDEMAHKLELAKQLISAEKLSDEARKEIRRFYYELAKKVHPDIHHEQSERLNSLWLQIATAYKNGNLEGMKALALVLEDDETDLETSNGNDLKDQRERLKKQLEQQALGLATLQQAFPYTIREQLGDPDWVDAQVAEIIKKQDLQAERMKQLLLVLDSVAEESENGEQPSCN